MITPLLCIYIGCGYEFVTHIWNPYASYRMCHELSSYLSRTHMHIRYIYMITYDISYVIMYIYRMCIWVRDTYMESVCLSTSIFMYDTKIRYIYTLYIHVYMFVDIHTHSSQNDARLRIHTFFWMTYRQTEKQTDIENQKFQYHRRLFALDYSVCLLDYLWLFLIALTDCICIGFFFLHDDMHIISWCHIGFRHDATLGFDTFDATLGFDTFVFKYVYRWQQICNCIGFWIVVGQLCI